MSMALIIALFTLIMLEIETLDRGLDKSYLICTYKHVKLRLSPMLMHEQEEGKKVNNYQDYKYSLTDLFQCRQGHEFFTICAVLKVNDLFSNAVKVQVIFILDLSGEKGSTFKVVC